MEKLLTVQQVAKLLGFTPRTIQIKLRCGEIKGYKVGNKYRVPWIEVKRHMEPASCRGD